MLSLYIFLGECMTNDDLPKDLRLITGFMQPLVINMKLCTLAKVST